VPAHHLPDPGQLPGVPVQSWHASHVQYNDGACDGFVRSVELVRPDGSDRDRPMGYWTAADLPFYAGLARTFTLADHWFGSCLGPTLPNRRFLLAGTANGLIDNLVVNLVDYPATGTVLDLLTRHGIDWVNYYPGSRAGSFAARLLGRSGLRVGRQLLRALGRVVPPLLDLFSGKIQFTTNVFPTGLATSITHLRGIDRYFEDAAAGTLPPVSIVDPDFHRFSEENPQDIRYGESFAADVIAAAMHGPAWRDTLLIWLYDEHGGYYDHVPPPSAPQPDGVLGHNRLRLPRWAEPLLRPILGARVDQLRDMDQGDRHYDRLGFRVPAVVVSPYARPGAVVSTDFDHTSVIRLIAEKWNLPPLTHRDAAAASPLELLDLTGDPAFAQPPSLPEPALGSGAWRSAPLPDPATGSSPRPAAVNR
jgi:phospholipase C